MIINTQKGENTIRLTIGAINNKKADSDFYAASGNAGKIVVDYGDNAEQFKAWMRLATFKEITLKATKITHLVQVFDGCLNLEKVTIIGDAPLTESWYAFYGCRKLKVIDFEIDGTHDTSMSNRFYLTDALVEVRFKPNTFGVGSGHLSNYALPVNSQVLSNASIISIANALYEGAATKQARGMYHNTVKNKLSTIMGRDTMDETNTFHIFVEDASGTINLQDFITNVKGWTIT